MKRLSLLSYALLVLALCAWGAVIYAGYRIEAAASIRADAINVAQQQADQTAYVGRLHSLVGETALGRAQLESLMSSDVVAIVSGLESAGKNVHAKVTTAAPEGTPTTLPGGGQLQAVGFAVNASGSFSDLMHALTVYEHLSLPSTVEGVDIEALDQTAAKAAPWNMTVHIRIITSAVISS